MATIGQKQLAVRVDDETLQLIDRKRMELATASGTIPTRSDVVRVALDQFLLRPIATNKRKDGRQR